MPKSPDKKFKDVVYKVTKKDYKIKIYSDASYMGIGNHNTHKCVIGGERIKNKTHICAVGGERKTKKTHKCVVGGERTTKNTHTCVVGERE